MATSEPFKSRQPTRPKSAVTSRPSHHKHHRLQDNQSLNSIRNDIHKVFTQENKFLKEVKELTSKLSPNYAKRVDRMCVQYSITVNPKKQKQLSDDVDVQFIAKRYVRAKSKDRMKEEERQELRRSIGETSRRYTPSQPQEFFQFSHEALRKMQLRANKKAGSRSKREHPYMALYQKSQLQALTHLTDRNSLALEQLNNHPALIQPQQWQLNSRQIKQIYSGVKILRSNTIRYRQRKKQQQLDSFYIT